MHTYTHILEFLAKTAVFRQLTIKLILLILVRKTK